MKKYVKAIALALALLLCLSFPVSVSAAEVADATIDTSRKERHCSLPQWNWLREP